MKYLVTGTKGQLGYDIVKELEQQGYQKIIQTDRETLDITNKQQVQKKILQEHPDVIFHCAAYTAVDKAEEEPDICEKVNVEGTKNLVEAAKKIGAKFVYISTDYVFDGEKEGNYSPDDVENPQSVYGKTKYQGEAVVKTLDKHFIVRISWVFGKNGNNFIKTMLRLADEKEELNVVNDQIGSPTYTKDLAKLLVEMIKTEKYGTYHATNEGYCSWAELAEYAIAKAGKNMKINRITTEEYPQKAKRPKNSRLNKDKLEEYGFSRLPVWKNAVDRFLEELKEE